MGEQIITIRNFIIRVIVLVTVFVLAVMVWSRVINQVTPDMASAMADSTFPLVNMNKDGTDFNCLHGYSREMDVSQIRQSITPLSSDRSITLRIQTFGAAVDSVAYEILTIDGTQSLENTKVIKLSQDGDYLTANLQLQGGMLMNKEYVMRIQVTTGGRNIYYYTHVLLADGLHTSDYLNFAAGFWDKCINRTDLDTIGAAVEPDSTTDIEKTLAYMDIHDSVNQLTWADFHPQIFYKPTPMLTEINENTATLTMDYRISANAEDGSTQIFNVHEYYRLRFTDSRVFMLNFERTTDQVFNPESGTVLNKAGIVLGITDRDVSYLTDSSAHHIAFVQENVLWTYAIQTGTFTRVFGFPQTENMDARDFYKENTIRILRLSDEGDVWFAVGGYMNRGIHEGDNGILLCYYDARSTMVTEMAFLDTNENTERVQFDLGSCLYMTQDEKSVYCLLNGVLYRIDLVKNEAEVLAFGVNNECYAGSSSGRYFAWLEEGKVYDSSVLNQIDFEKGEIRKITAPEGERIRPLTFMKEDLVYGIARASEIDVRHGGNGVFPMYSVRIEDEEGNQVKDYQAGGLYVTSISQSDNLLNLSRVSRNGSGFIEATPDQIVSTDTSSDVAFGVATMEDSRRQTQVLLRVGSSISHTTPQLINSKIVSGQRVPQIDIPENPEAEDLYYVYASGGLDAICTYPNEAIVKADEMFGVVVDHNLDYVWVRGDKDVKCLIDVENVPAAVRSGTTDIAQLEAGLGTDVIDVSGCSLDEVLYFVSHGRPVIAQTEEGVKIIVGYDDYNTLLLNPGEDEWYYYGINDSTNLFLRSGNEFYSYMNPVR
jgi:hypothetical protein